MKGAHTQVPQPWRPETALKSLSPVASLGAALRPSALPGLHIWTQHLVLTGLGASLGMHAH